MLARPDDDVTTTALQRLVIGVVLLVLAIGLGIRATLEADIDSTTGGTRSSMCSRPYSRARSS